MIVIFKHNEVGVYKEGNKYTFSHAKRTMISQSFASFIINEDGSIYCCNTKANPNELLGDITKDDFLHILDIHLKVNLIS